MELFKPKLPHKESRIDKSLLIAALFIVVIALEFSTPNEYVFGYLYTGPILLANSWLGRFATLKATVVAVCLTMLNLVMPGGDTIQAATVANRAIAAMALIVTGVLSNRLRRSEEAIALTRAKLEAKSN